MTAPREMLRRQLEQADPDLHRALMRNWETAWAEWLPALGSKSDSYNSYPHIRNVEHHLDNLLMVEEGSSGSSRRVQFRPVEVYVLLAAALFHDIGLTKEKEGHAAESLKLVAKHHASFGIPSKELASIIGRVCRAHDSEQGPNDPELAAKVVEPYGEVRARFLATLLFVGDHMDSAFRRVLPEYIRPEGKIDVVGAFRRVIRGVQVEQRAKMIRTVLGDLDEEDMAGGKNRKGLARLKYFVVVGPAGGGHGERDPKDPRQWFLEDEALRQARDEIEKLAPGNAASAGAGSSALAKFLERLERVVSTKDKRELEYCPAFDRLASRVPLVEAMCGHQGGKAFKEIDWLIARKRMFVKRDDEEVTSEEEVVWPREKLLAAVVGDLFGNAVALARVREHMAAMGIPLRAWLLEWNENLFNSWGEKTYEPVFSKDYLEHVAVSMWDLSTRVFGRSLFDYRNLADAICDPDVEKVHMAVQRIARVAQCVSPERCDCRGAVWAGESAWRWNAGSRTDHDDQGRTDQEKRDKEEKRMSRWCWSIHIHEVVKAIRNLGEPI